MVKQNLRVNIVRLSAEDIERITKEISNEIDVNCKLKIQGNQLQIVAQADVNVIVGASQISDGVHTFNVTIKPESHRSNQKYSLRPRQKAQKAEKEKSTAVVRADQPSIGKLWNKAKRNY